MGFLLKVVSCQLMGGFAIAAIGKPENMIGVFKPDYIVSNLPA